MALSPVSRLGVIGTFVFYHNKSPFPWKPKTDKGACKAITDFVFFTFMLVNSTNKLLYLFVKSFSQKKFYCDRQASKKNINILIPKGN